jgi:alpha-amylase
MKSISLSFQIHHPFHFQTFRFLDIGTKKSYYDDLRIEREINEAATNYYLPANEFLLKLIKKQKEKLKVAFYISGTAIDQFLMYEPEVLTSFRQLADTGQVEFLGGTASHSLISLTNQKDELINQLKNHQSKMAYLFGKKPTFFVNTDLIYSDLIGNDVADSGYQAMITNGSRKALIWRSSNYVYSNFIQPTMHVYFRNEMISDELTGILNNLNSDVQEINANNFTSLLKNLNPIEPLLNIYIDYKTLGGFGIEKKEKFFQSFVSQICRMPRVSFVLPSEIAEMYGPVAEINANEPICWLNNFHSYYYPGNELQMEAIKQLYQLKEMVANIDDINLEKDWQYLQTSDHIHLMDDQHPAYFSNNISNCIYKSKYDAFINFMNILDDLRIKILEETKSKEKRAASSPRKEKKQKTK